jgi:putative membrane protein (TIGR04086 family)
LKEKVETKNITIEEDKHQITALMTGVFIGYAITCLAMITYALLITYLNFTGEALPLIVTITSLASAIVAGFDSGKCAKNKGWLWGMVAGSMYALILIALGIWINQGFLLDSRTIALTVLSVSGGGVGGVIGINFSKK